MNISRCCQTTGQQSFTYSGAMLQNNLRDDGKELLNYFSSIVMQSCKLKTLVGSCNKICIQWWIQGRRPRLFCVKKLQKEEKLAGQAPPLLQLRQWVCMYCISTVLYLYFVHQEAQCTIIRLSFQKLKNRVIIQSHQGPPPKS